MHVYPFVRQCHLKNYTDKLKMDSVIPPHLKKKNRHQIFCHFRESSQIYLLNIILNVSACFSKCLGCTKNQANLPVLYLLIWFLCADSKHLVSSDAQTKTPYFIVEE